MQKNKEVGILLNERKLKLLEKENKSLHEENIFLKKELDLFLKKNDLNDELAKSIQNNMNLYKELNEYKKQYKKLCLEVSAIEVDYKRKIEEILKQIRKQLKNNSIV